MIKLMMMEEKCNYYVEEGILGYRKEKTYTAAAKENKREKKPHKDKERMRTNRTKTSYAPKFIVEDLMVLFNEVQKLTFFIKMEGIF